MARREGRTRRCRAGRPQRHRPARTRREPAGALALDVDDVDAFLAMVAAMPPDVAAQAESHGVVLPMTVYVQA